MKCYRLYKQPAEELYLFARTYHAKLYECDKYAMYLIADESNPNNSPVIAIEHADDVRGYETDVYKYDGSITYHIIDNNVCYIHNLEEIRMYSEKCLQSVNSRVHAKLKEEIRKQKEFGLYKKDKNMNFTPHDVRVEFLRLINGDEEPCYIYWKEIPRTKVWYDESDNTFHTDLDINIVFDGYDVDDVDLCLYDLHDKIIKEMEKRGITIHDAFIEESYEATHKTNEQPT